MGLMKIRSFIFAAALLMPSAVLAQSSDEVLFDLGSQEAASLEGNWALQLGGTTIFRFDIEKDGSKWSGTWLRPDSFASDGNVFARLKGPVERVPSMAGLNFAGMVELSFDDPRPGAIPDIFRFRLDDDDVAQLTYVGTDLEPYDLVRVDKDADIGDWNDAVIYRRPVAERQLQVVPVEVSERVIADQPELSEVTQAEDGPEEMAEALGEEPSPESSDRPRIEADFLDGL